MKLSSGIPRNTVWETLEEIAEIQDQKNAHFIHTRDPTTSSPLSGTQSNLFSIKIDPKISSCHILAGKLTFFEISELYYTNI